MFASCNLKIYRKFLILFLLVASLSLTINSTQTTSASQMCTDYTGCCCTFCPILIEACEEDCYFNNPPNSSELYWCLEACNQNEYLCAITCSPFC